MSALYQANYFYFSYIYWLVKQKLTFLFKHSTVILKGTLKSTWHFPFCFRKHHIKEVCENEQWGAPTSRLKRVAGLQILTVKECSALTTRMKAMPDNDWHLSIDPAELDVLRLGHFKKVHHFLFVIENLLLRF